MRVKINLFFAIFACTTAYFSHSHAATPQPFSQYGMIQNVQNYSSNPFWNPHSPYNTRFPTAVYAKGPKIDTAECQTVVYNLVASVCVTQNNCVSMELSDIRPAVLLALSRMGQGNYATACGGYLDDAFEKFRTRTAQTGPVGQTAFPDATVPNTNADGVTIEYYNPFESQKPEWALDMKDRADELAALHAQTHPNADHITKAAFPATYADLSFEERIANEQAGYEPYQDKPAYQQIDIKVTKKTPTLHNIELTYQFTPSNPES